MCTPTPTPTPAVPAIASVAATPSSWNWFEAPTRTLALEVTWARLPTYADVLAVTTSTTPEMLTAAVPANPAEMPTPAIVSLLVAVTATPCAVSVVTLTTGCPFWPPSPVGAWPFATTLCDRPEPGPGSLRWIAGPPLVADSCRVV